MYDAEGKGPPQAMYPGNSGVPVDVVQVLHDGSQCHEHCTDLDQSRLWTAQQQQTPQTTGGADFGLPSPGQKAYPLLLSQELESHYMQKDAASSSSSRGTRACQDQSSPTPLGGPPGTFFQDEESPGMCILSTTPLRRNPNAADVSPAPHPVGPVMRYDFGMPDVQAPEQGWSENPQPHGSASAPTALEEDKLILKNTFIHVKDSEEEFLTPLRQVRSCPGSRLPSPRGRSDSGGVDKLLIDSLREAVLSLPKLASREDSDNSSLAAGSTAAESSEWEPATAFTRSPQQAPQDSNTVNLDLLGTPLCPSMGSAGHARGLCKPCAFIGRVDKKCTSGIKCTFCHLCSPGEKQRRKKEKMALIRQRQKTFVV